MQSFANAIFVERGNPSTAIAKALGMSKPRRVGRGARRHSKQNRGFDRGKPSRLLRESKRCTNLRGVVGVKRRPCTLGPLSTTAIHVSAIAATYQPAGRRRSCSIQRARHYTDQLMLTLARMLPPEYRGVYADRIETRD